ncbi:GNAT family N-acetyltransferase [Kiloniella majae]|uniref:GNAT family N-acetyltransferase n=1 Tax=Kiloniella majae TaxID=1938558 RepID=UPI000A278621|nr:GNAT family N-acetyltransferase [Kiloniella majae]
MSFMEIVLLNDGRIIRPCGIDDIEDVSEMVIAEAKRSIASDFDEKGWNDFEDYVSFDQILKRLVTGSKALLVQEEDDRISGYLEINDKQILLLFIADYAQKRHLATQLFRRVVMTLSPDELYVNASSQGYDFYCSHGFVALDEWCEKEGLKYRPMKWENES